MNKVILMSIQPKWLVKILNGDKTIEIRKRMPKCELPIDVYLYCTKEKPYITQQSNYQFTIRDTKDYTNLVNGRVVAKFTLNKVDELEIYDFWKEQYYWKNTALDMDDIVDYDNGKQLYAWHIDNLLVFDKPMGLRDFSIFKRETITCGMDCPPYTDWVEYRVRKAPQSWQYAYI